MHSLSSFVRESGSKVRSCFTAAVLALGLTACQSTIPINYAPSSALSAMGNVGVGDFAYLPADSGDVQPNEIRNTALGSPMFDRNIDDIFHDAVLTELRFVGVNVANENLQLTGEIREFLIDDLGFSVDWTIDVNYVVTNMATGAVVYEAQKTATNTTSKFANPFGALNEQIKGNIESLIRDPQFIAAIN